MKGPAALPPALVQAEEIEALAGRAALSGDLTLSLFLAIAAAALRGSPADRARGLAVLGQMVRFLDYLPEHCRAAAAGEEPEEPPGEAKLAPTGFTD
jgi:hypothetical protein